MKASGNPGRPRGGRWRPSLVLLLAAMGIGGAAAGQEREPETIPGFVRAADFPPVEDATIRGMGRSDEATAGREREPETISGFVRAADLPPVDGATIRVMGRADEATAGREREPETISGFVRAADFQSVEGATIRVIGGTEEATADAEGRFTLRTGVGHAPRLEVRLDGYYRSVIRLESGERGAPPVVLVPRRWTITAGRYAGEVVAIDLEGATGAACGDCGAFYGRVLGDERSFLAPGIPSWPATAFPLDVAFDRENGALVSAGDSAAFWRIVGAMEEHFGLRLFRPAPLPRVLANVANDGPGSLLVLIDPRLLSTGWGSSVAQSGDILAGAVHFRHARTFSSPDGAAIVAHEIFHALGFGHTCRWRSIVADVKRCRGNQAPAPTASDVAHAQLLWRIRELERGARISTTVAAALPSQPLESH